MYLTKYAFILFIILKFSYSNSTESSEAKSQDINLAVVACGDRVPETIVLLKSALIFTQRFLNFYIFTEAHLRKEFSNQFEDWKKISDDKFSYKIYDVQFPKDNLDEWRRLFRECASQRIFLPDILTDVDSLLYVDTDVLFTSPIEELWSHFDKFNSTQLAALAPEHEQEWQGWYNRFARHPYYGKLGLNSGVMLMNLTRMREFQFTTKVKKFFLEYKSNITWGDQCLLNILFHFYPETLFVYDCKWNYRPDHCMYGSNCKAAEEEGARVLHGCRRVFHNDKEIAFAKIYETFKNFKLFQTTKEKLLQSLNRKLSKEKVAETYCGKSKDNFLKYIKKIVDKEISRTIANKNEEL